MGPFLLLAGSERSAASLVQGVGGGGVGVGIQVGERTSYEIAGHSQAPVGREPAT